MDYDVEGIMIKGSSKASDCAWLDEYEKNRIVFGINYSAKEAGDTFLYLPVILLPPRTTIHIYSLPIKGHSIFCYASFETPSEIIECGKFGGVRMYCPTNTQQITIHVPYNENKGCDAFLMLDFGIE